MSLCDVPEIVTNCFRLVDKELSLCLEIALLKNHMDRRRISMHGINGVAFGWAQIEIDAIRGPGLMIYSAWHLRRLDSDGINRLGPTTYSVDTMKL